MISLSINDFFSLRDVGSTDLTVVAWCGMQLSVLISSTQLFVFQSCFFFGGGGVGGREREYGCLAIFSAIRLFSLYLVTEFINVRCEWNFLCPPWPVRLVSMSWRSLVLLGCFYSSTPGKISIGTVGTIFIERKTFYKIHLDTKNWSQVTKCIVQFILAVA